MTPPDVRGMMFGREGWGEERRDLEIDINCMFCHHVLLMVRKEVRSPWKFLHLCFKWIIMERVLYGILKVTYDWYYIRKRLVWKWCERRYRTTWRSYDIKERG